MLVSYGYVSSIQLTFCNSPLSLGSNYQKIIRLMNKVYIKLLVFLYSHAPTLHPILSEGIPKPYIFIQSWHNSVMKKKTEDNNIKTYCSRFFCQDTSLRQSLKEPFVCQPSSTLSW